MSRPRKIPPPYPNGEPTSLEWALFAGFFSGEGSIGSSIHPNQSVQLTLTVRQAERGPLDWIHSIFGGRVRVGKQGQGTFTPGKTVYIWYVSSYGEVARLLRGMYPYLICKKKQAALAVNLPDKPRPLQHAMHYRIRELKHCT